MIYKYGAMSSLYKLEADNHFIAIAAMVAHYREQAHLMVVYEPKDCPSFTNFTGKISARLDEIFINHGGFDKFFSQNTNSISNAYKTIERVV